MSNVKRTINDQINDLMKCEGVVTNDVSDGYHTFKELYEHRIVLYISLCKSLYYDTDNFHSIWKSNLHSDGSSFEGWFTLGIDKIPGDQITYHLPLSYWEDCWFAEELSNAPEWDQHSPADVLERIKQL